MNASERRRRLAELEPVAARAATFVGWDFSVVNRSQVGPGLPWDYVAEATAASARARSILDLGTGGGERFAEILGPVPRADRRAVATEPWSVNAAVAHARLGPIGVDLAYASNLWLPFADASFDLVLNRHADMDPVEVARTLAPGGVVLTQQVYKHHWIELNQFFPRRQGHGDHLRSYVAGLDAAGLTVEASHCDTKVAFTALADFAFMLLVTPWEVPGFDVEQDLDALLALEAALGTPGGIVLTECHYLLRAASRAA